MAVSQLASNIEQFTFEISDVSERLRVVDFSGNESLSQPFYYNITLAVENTELDFSSIVGKSAVLTILNYDTEVARYVNGIISSIEQAELGRRFTTYRVELVPQLKLLDHRQNCRIFQESTIPDIIGEVLDSANVSSNIYKFSLQASYSPREFCVQYRETDLDFISRLMEEVGIFYFFEHTKDKHILVIADSASVHNDISGEPKISYHEPSSAVSDEDYIFNFNYEEKIVSGRLALKDFNFKKPALNLLSEKQGDVDVDLEVYDYPGKYEVPEVGSNRVSVQLEGLQADRKTATGSTTTRRLIPGYLFSLIQHPRSSFEQEYLITEVTQSGQQPGVLEEGAGESQSSYTCEFFCMPASVPFRMDTITMRPVINGIQTAIVVGPKGEEIYTDEHGRVKVQFHWDRIGIYNEKSSCWIRVSQLIAGSSWGSMFIPRIGQEVIVDFIEGDPDRPMITGRVYHGTNKPPYTLPDEKTKSTIKTNSSKGGKGFNELRFEDKKGEEEVFIHAEKDQQNRTKNDSVEWVGNDQHLVVKNNQVEIVEADKHQQVKGDQNLKIDGTLSIDTGGDVQQKTGSNFAHDAGSEIHFKAGSKLILEAGSEITLKVGSNFVKIDPSGVTIKGSILKLNSGGSAGSGSSASPDAPIDPLEAVTDKAGKVAELPKPPPKPKTYSPAAQVLKKAAEDGTPFCEKCAAAASK